MAGEGVTLELQQPGRPPQARQRVRRLLVRRQHPHLSHHPGDPAPLDGDLCRVWGWIFHEGREDEITNALGGWFCAVNQAYFMGLFLFIAAYFVPGSYDRKGPARFVVDRLVRLGIPLLVYSWILRPLFIYFVLHLREGMRFGAWYRTVYFRTYGILGGGPLWFIELLLLFSLVYVVARLLTSRRPPRLAPEGRFPSSGRVALFALLLGVVSFVVRLVFRVDESFRPLNLQLPTLLNILPCLCRPGGLPPQLAAVAAPIGWAGCGCGSPSSSFSCTRWRAWWPVTWRSLTRLKAAGTGSRCSRPSGKPLCASACA